MKHVGSQGITRSPFINGRAGWGLTMVYGRYNYS